MANPEVSGPEQADHLDIIEQEGRAASAMEMMGFKLKGRAIRTAAGQGLKEGEPAAVFQGTNESGEEMEIIIKKTVH